MELSQKFKLSITLGAIVLFIIMCIDIATQKPQQKEVEIDYAWCTRTADVEAEFIRNGNETAESACALLASENCPEINCTYMKDVEAEWHPGKLTSSGDSQLMPVLTTSESHQRFIELCEKYNLPADVIWHTENFYGLKEGTILCIAIAETSGGKNGWGKPGCWNYGNVGNNDGGDRHCFPNQGAGLAAIGKTLNNSLLGPNKTISCLNGAGNCVEPYATGYRYSTGKSGNWERNLISCFHTIYQIPINPETFNLHQR